MNLNGTEYYYIRNSQGDIIGLFDESGTIVVEYVYDSWGKLISTTGSLASSVGAKNPYRYRGYRYDSETNLYYLQSRYYNPDFGRFINADGLVGNNGELLSHNMFLYCLNNHVNMCDPSGYVSEWIKNTWNSVKETTKAIFDTVIDFAITIYDSSKGTNLGPTKDVIDKGITGKDIYDTSLNLISDKSIHAQNVIGIAIEDSNYELKKFKNKSIISDEKRYIEHCVNVYDYMLIHLEVGYNQNLRGLSWDDMSNIKNAQRDVVDGMVLWDPKFYLNFHRDYTGDFWEEGFNFAY